MGVQVIGDDFKRLHHDTLCVGSTFRSLIDRTAKITDHELSDAPDHAFDYIHTTQRIVKVRDGISSNWMVAVHYDQR